MYNGNIVTWGYTRLSKKNDDGVSLESQRERIEEYCRYKEYHLDRIICDDGISGGINRQREGFVELLSAVEDGEVGAVVLFSLDRLSRDMLTLLSLERLLDEHDVELHTVEGAVNTSTPDGFMNFAMKAFLGEMERRQIKYRTKKAMQFKKQNNEVVGSVSYGFKREGNKLIPLESEQIVIEEINVLYEKGMNLSQIARELSEKGMVTRSGKPWKAQQVKRLINGYEGKWKKRKSKLGAIIKEFILSVA